MPGSVRQMAAFGSSARVVGGLLVRRQLRSPRTRVGRRLTFADGSTSWVFRETRRVGTSTRDPALLVVRFRLRLAGRNRLLHALFRAESIANIPLFAGFPGFRSKLWLSDQQTRIYRGVYEWDGADRADRYATTLVALLRPVCARGSVGFHIEPGIRLDDFLRDPGAVAGAGHTVWDRWWRLRVGAAA